MLLFLLKNPSLLLFTWSILQLTTKRNHRNYALEIKWLVIPTECPEKKMGVELRIARSINISYLP